MSEFLYDYDKPLFNHQRLKKQCISCFSSPQNILVLGCQHSICLSCVYHELEFNNINKTKQVEFKCIKCKEITYFDEDLLNQIEVGIEQRFQFQQKSTNKKTKLLDGIPLIRQYKDQLKVNKQYDGQRNNDKKSFIDKMKKQYLNSVESDKKQSVKNKIEKPIYLQQKTKNVYQHDEGSYIKSKEQQQKTLKCQKDQSLQHNQTKILLYYNCHLGYQQNYFCLKCQQNVCSQCLLHGSHKLHENKSFKSILQTQLSLFMNKASDHLLNRLSKIQSQQQIQKNKLKQRKQQISLMKNQTMMYFKQIRQNIEREQSSMIRKCDQLLNDLLEEERGISEKMRERNQELYGFINEIKMMKQQYQYYMKIQEQDLKKSDEKRDIQRHLVRLYVKNSNKLDIAMIVKDRNKSKKYQGQPYKVVEQNKQNDFMRLNEQLKESIRNLRESMVFENLVHENQKGVKNQLKNGHQKSYFSTQHTKISEKSNFETKKQHSPSLSPYRGQKNSYFYSKKQNNLKKHQKSPFRVDKNPRKQTSTSKQDSLMYYNDKDKNLSNKKSILTTNNKGKVSQNKSKYMNKKDSCQFKRKHIQQTQNNTIQLNNNNF